MFRPPGGGGGGGAIGGTIAANQIAFGTGVDTIGGNANFTFDPLTNYVFVNGRLGIGTATPSAPLHAVGGGLMTATGTQQFEYSNAAPSEGLQGIRSYVAPQAGSGAINFSNFKGVIDQQTAKTGGITSVYEAQISVNGADVGGTYYAFNAGNIVAGAATANAFAVGTGWDLAFEIDEGALQWDGGKALANDKYQIARNNASAFQINVPTGASILASVNGSTAVKVRSDKGVEIGGVGFGSEKLWVEASVTDSSFAAFEGKLTATPTGASAANYFGNYYFVSKEGAQNVTGTIAGIYGQAVSAATGGTSSKLYGVLGNGYQNGGTTTLLTGVTGNVSVQSGTATEAIALYAAPFNTFGGTITTAYGAKIDPPGVGTTRWTLGVGFGASYVNGRFTVGAVEDAGAVTMLVRGAAGAGSGGLSALWVSGGAHTSNANADINDIRFDLNRTVQLAGGGAAIALMRPIYITAPTYTALAAQTITDLATVYIDDAPSAGANVTITGRSAMYLRTTGSGATTLTLEKSNATQNVPQISLIEAPSRTNTGSIFSGTDGANTGTFLTSYSNHGVYFTARAGVNTAQMVLNPSGNLGIGTMSPKSMLHVNGSISVKRTASAAGNYTVLATDFLVGKSGITGGGDTVTLPDPAVAEVGRLYLVKDESGTAGTNSITINAAAGNVDGAASKTINVDYGSVWAYTNGSNWFLV